MISSLCASISVQIFQLETDEDTNVKFGILVMVEVMSGSVVTRMVDTSLISRCSGVHI